MSIGGVEKLQYMPGNLQSCVHTQSCVYAQERDKKTNLSSCDKPSDTEQTRSED